MAAMPLATFQLTTTPSPGLLDFLETKPTQSLPSASSPWTPRVLTRLATQLELEMLTG
jgi:hypothetical protein